MRRLCVAAALAVALFTTSVHAEESVAELKQELEQTKAMLKKLEARLAAVEAKNQAVPVKALEPAAGTPKRTSNNAFNPAISAVLMGGYNAYSRNPADAMIAGFAQGEEAGLPSRGFSLGESELNVSANIDNMFYGALTAALHEEGGETEIELEEAYIETLALPYGAKVKAGRMFPTIGYLNELHRHADTFIDRPLPYRAFLGGGNLADDGVQLSVVLPTDWFTEIGGGAFRGTGFPASDGGNGARTQTAFARVGGDVGVSNAWLAGFSYLNAKATGRETDDVTFNGDTQMVVAHGKYSWAPGGNTANEAVAVQGEYFWRNEDGDYNDVLYDRDSSGWYAQAVYKFLPRWKTGYRFASLNGGGIVAGLEDTALDGQGHTPRTHSLLLEFDNSEFSSIRLQYTRDDADVRSNNAVMLWYTVNMGAHGAHPF